MHNLKTMQPAFDLAKTTDASTDGQCIFLSGGEMEKAQRHGTIAVTDPAQQHPALAHLNITTLDHAFGGTGMIGT